MRQDKHTRLRKELDRKNREMMKAGHLVEAAWKKRTGKVGVHMGCWIQTEGEKLSSLKAEAA